MKMVKCNYYSQGRSWNRGTTKSHYRNQCIGVWSENWRKCYVITNLFKSGFSRSWTKYRNCSWSKLK